MYIFFRSDYCSRYHLGSSKTSPSWIHPLFFLLLYIWNLVVPFITAVISKSWSKLCEKWRFLSPITVLVDVSFFKLPNIHVAGIGKGGITKRACQELWLFSDQLFFNTDGMTDKRMLQIISGLSKNDLIHHTL